MAGEERVGVKTVRILSHEFLPFDEPARTIGAQRVFQFAKWLPEFRWKVVWNFGEISPTKRPWEVERPTQAELRGNSLREKSRVLDPICRTFQYLQA